MKYQIYILLLLVLWSCKNQNSEKKIINNSLKSSESNAITNKKLNIFIKDSSLYDQEFINGFADFNEPIKLIDNYIIAGEDSCTFSNDLPRNKKTFFKGIDKRNTFLLSVIRTNWTNLDYNFQLSDKDGITIYSISGKAILGSMFFLGTETDVDSKTFISYLSEEYVDKKIKNGLTIRIEIGKSKKDKQRAIVHYLSEDKYPCPTLRKEK